MSDIYLEFQNKVYTEEKFKSLTESYKTNDDCTDIANMPYDTDYIVSVLSAVENNKPLVSGGISLSAAAINKWLEFNCKVLEKKNIDKVYIEDSEKLLNSLAWIAGIRIGRHIVFSETPTDADMAVVSLDSLINGKINLSEYKAVISVGTEKSDFNRIKKDSADTLWINYYAFPYCFCVSYAQSAVIGGREEIFHQLKPVAGFDTKITDKSGKSVSANVSGFLNQQIGEESVNNGVCCTFTSDGKIYAYGFSADRVYTDNMLFIKSDIEDVLLRSDLINDCAVRENKIYFSQQFSYSEYQLKSVLSKSSVNKAKSLEFIEVPFIPYKNGTADFEKLSELTSAVYKKKNEIADKLKAEYDGDSFVIVDYENNSDSILSAKNDLNADAISDDI